MNDIIREANALAAEMESVKKFNDDIFIQYYEQEESMQERLEEQEKAGKLSPAQKKECSDRLAAAFETLRGKLSFCNLK